MEGTRYDIRNKMDYLTTTVEFALKDPAFRKPFYNYLKDVLKRKKSFFKNA